MDRDYFAKREWSFTIEDDIYIRYQSFKTEKEFREAIQKRQPHKIDIGAVFTAPPKDHDSLSPEQFRTCERELVFDIDMTDYDDIRTCCTGANICHKCWPYMTMALKVVDEALREDFDFHHILWVYSGRRGIHCWVSDPEARALSNEARSAIVEYLSCQVGSSENSDTKGAKATFTTPLHPMLRRAYATLEPYFENCICHEKGQGLLGTKARYMKILNKLPHEGIRKELYEAWERDDSLTGAQRWQQMKAACSPSSQNVGTQVKKKAKIDTSTWDKLYLWCVELVFTHCYPRLDANVSKMQNHLLKSPFCVHPKTGRVCVPIDPANAQYFDPFSVPTVRTLCEEVDIYERANPGQKDIDDKEKTSLKASIDLFDRVMMNGLKSTIKKGFQEKSKLMRDIADQEAAMMTDF